MVTHKLHGSSLLTDYGYYLLCPKIAIPMQHGVQ